MSNAEYLKLAKTSLRDRGLNEQWVQRLIADDPSILGLGELILKDKERLQPRAGRLDLLLQDPETHRRFEVEVQLGRTDESHIIRTIEYWDLERKRYPMYEHTAVIVAEEVNARFLNVIGLFNGVIPLVAIQMSALALEHKTALVFTTVVDQVSLGLIEDDEAVQTPTDRDYWEKRATATTMGMADALRAVVREVAGNDFDLKYNKFYIGLIHGGRPNNFVSFVPQKTALRLSVRVPRSEGFQKEMEQAGFDVISYDEAYGTYSVRVLPDDITKRRAALVTAVQRAYEETGR